MNLIHNELKNLYKKDINIINYLKENEDLRTDEMIEISYDLQAGTYTKNILSNKDLENYYNDYTKELSEEIKSLCSFSSILEAGVGEATTLANLLDKFNNIKAYGFDISFSRLLYAKKYLDIKKHKNINLCTGNLYDIPFLDNSIDIVYTSHTIEPNGGGEIKILKELYRVTNKYLVLLEPAYEFASEEVKERMDHHGYCKNLKEYAEDLGYNVVKYQLFKYSANQNNPTAILIIEKNNKNIAQLNKFACAKYKTPLVRYNNEYLYSEDSLYLYPIVKGISMLRKENAILATNLEL